MEPIDFLYANAELQAPKGMEEKVAPLKCFVGDEYINACFKLSAEEIAEISKTGVIWISQLGKRWVPTRAEAFIPRNKPIDLILYSDKTASVTQLLAYLDLNLVLLDIADNEKEFRYNKIQDDPAVWALSFKRALYTSSGVDGDAKAIEELSDRSSPETSYLFSVPLTILGRLRDLDRLQPLKMLYPDLKDSLLVLAPMPEPEAKIILLGR